MASSGQKLNPLMVDPMDETLPCQCDDDGCGGAKEFPFYGLLERHRVDLHGEDEVMVCGRCATGFKRKMHLVLHWRSTAHRLIKLVGCDVCDAFGLSNGFPDEENLAEHTDEVHGEGTIINPKEYKEGQEYRCPFCRDKAVFKLRRPMMEHLQTAHLEHLYKDLLGVEDEAVRKELMEQKSHQCDMCKRTFRLKSVLEKHKASHSKAESVEKPVAAAVPATPTPAPAAAAPAASTAATVAGAASPVPPPSPAPSPIGVEFPQAQQVPKVEPVAVSTKSTPPVTTAKSRDTPPPPPQSQQPQPQQQPQRADLVPAVKSHQCRYCDKTFTRPTVLRMHMEMVHSEAYRRDGGDAGGGGASSPSPAATKPSFAPRAPGAMPGAGVRPPPPSAAAGPGASFLHQTATKVLCAPRPQTTGLMPMQLQSMAPRPKGPPVLPPPQRHFNKTSNGNSATKQPFFGPRKRASDGGKKSGGGGGSAKHSRSSLSGVGGPKRDSSSEEDDEGIPKHANVIKKRVRDCDENDKDWTSSVRVGKDSVRSSTRIKVKKTAAEEREKERLAAAKEEDHQSSSAESNGHSAANGRINGHRYSTIGKEYVKITRPYERPKPKEEKPEESETALENGGEPPVLEVCIVEGCDKKFKSYYSMMRHVAFKHQAERTMFYMKFRSTEPPPYAPPSPPKEVEEEKAAAYENRATTSVPEMEEEGQEMEVAKLVVAELVNGVADEFETEANGEDTAEKAVEAKDTSKSNIVDEAKVSGTQKEEEEEEKEPCAAAAGEIEDELMDTVESEKKETAEESGMGKEEREDEASKEVPVDSVPSPPPPTPPASASSAPTIAAS